MDSGSPHVLAIPFPAQGHINPLMRLCKLLASHGLLITVVNVESIDNRISESLSRHDRPPLPAIDATQLPRIRRVHVPAPGLDMSNDFRVSFEHFITVTNSLDAAVEQLIERLSNEGPPVTYVISDLYTSAFSQRVANKFNIPRISFLTCSQSFNLFCFYVVSGKINVKDAILALQDIPVDKHFHDTLPGLPSLRVADLPTYRHFKEESEVIYYEIVRHSSITYAEAHAIIVNSFDELEGPAFEVLRKNLRPKVYSLGPLVEELADEASTSLWKEEDDCLQWLQDQPPQSVLYVSFGSISLLSKLQFEEILIGLEASNHRFLFVVRPGLVEDAVSKSVPNDFLERTKDRGYVVQWAPQMRVLSDPAVGGFLTHCGWNSTIEAIANGVPMLCWLYLGDQFIDAKCIVEEWKVGLRFKAGKDGFVSREEVEKEVKELMGGEEGKLLRKNAAKLRDAGCRSLQKGGSSYQNTQALVGALSSQPKG